MYTSLIGNYKILSTTGELLTDCIKGEHLLCLFVLRFLRTSSSALTKHAQTAQAGKSSEDLGDSAETGAAQDMPQNFRGLRNFIDKNLSSYTVVLKHVTVGLQDLTLTLAI